MNSMKNSVDPKVVEKIASKFGLSKSLIEIHLNALEIAQQLQKYDKTLILFGGTAAQFYIPSNLQRTSLDVDLITNYSYKKIDEVMEGFFPQIGLKPIKGKKLKTTYGTRFSVPVELNFSTAGFSREPCVKVEIVSKTKEQFNKTNMKKSILHDLDMGEFILLSREDIFSKKLITLDIDNLGIHKDSGRDLPLNMSKQISDIYRLYLLFDKSDFQNVGKNLFQQLENEIKNCNSDSKPDSCIENICSIMRSLSLVETTKSDNESKILTEGYKSLRNFYLPKDAKMDFNELGSLGWTFEHLLKSILLDNKNVNNTKILEHYDIKEKYKTNDKTERVKVLEELSVYKDIPKPYKNRPLYSLFFEKDLMQGLK